MRAGTALAAVMAVAAIVPSAAAADQRYAAAAGTPADPCTQNDPCDFETAVEGAAGGDEVIVEPGVHTPPGQVSLATAAVVHGVEGQPAPQIVSAAGTAISVTDPNAELRWLEVTHSGAGDGVRLDDGLGQRLRVRSPGGGLACHVRGATLRDSVCWATGSGGLAAGMDATGSPEETTLVNVTAVASGAGSRGLSVEASAGAFANLFAFNTIADGAIDTEVDSDGASVAIANIDYSNFATQSVVGPNSFATPPGTARNQDAPPSFADAASGDFHQTEDSPTVESGTLEHGVGDLDAYGEQRVDGFALDIGADELIFGAPPPDTNPPETKILKKPEPRTRKRTARFKFGTTEPFAAQFYCSLDGKAYDPCKSPKKLRVRRGRRHTFAVFSVDEAGNVDPTPDQYSWKVTRKQG